VTETEQNPAHSTWTSTTHKLHNMEKAELNRRKAQNTLSYITLSILTMLSGIKESRMGKFPQSFELTLAAGRTKKFKFGPHL